MCCFNFKLWIIFFITLLLPSITYASDWKDFYQSSDGNIKASVDLDIADMELYSTKEHPDKIWWAKTWIKINTPNNEVKMDMTFHFHNESIIRSNTFYYDKYGHLLRKVKAKMTPESDDVYYSYNNALYEKAYGMMVEKISGIKLPNPGDKNYSILLGSTQKNGLKRLNSIPKYTIYIGGINSDIENENIIYFINEINEISVIHPTYSVSHYYKSYYDKKTKKIVKTGESIVDTRQKGPIKYKYFTKPEYVDVIPDSNGDHAIKEVLKFCKENPEWVTRSRGGIKSKIK